MLCTIILLLLLAVAVIMLLAVRQPDEFRVTRSALLPAAQARVFSQVNDLRLWQAWSPWARLDPQCDTRFEGSAEGVGAVMSWNGNSKVGQGRMTILESRPNDFIRFQLQFFKPFKASNTAEFTFAAQGDGTLVTWTMFGTNNFVGKCMGLVINCDKMVGGQFEQGLANLAEILQTK